MPFSPSKTREKRLLSRALHWDLGGIRQGNRRRHRGGFTLLEVMIATAVTLLMMVGLAQIFKVIGDSMNQGRAALELNNRLRSVVHRIRSDLENVTAIPNPPAKPGDGKGYLKYYDGPCTDFTFGTVAAGQNRFGDVDDIFMATVKAKDVWFTGKVPRFIVEKRIPGALDPDELTDDLNGNGLLDILEDTVTIASQYAEVIMFTQPLVASSKTGFAYSNPTRDPAYLVLDPSFYQDDNADSLPDAFRLHYRTLLIRPDLNLTNGLLPGVGSIMVAQPQTITSPSTLALPTPTCDMYRIHGLCDLSIRRAYNASDGLTGTADYVAANSLEDLADPANRFAHVRYSLNAPANTAYTMPVLALGPAMGFQTPASTVAGSGFLHPAYGLLGTRVGEDLLATNILAFDVKAFDSSVPILGSIGPDAAFGTAGIDDDMDGTPDNASELGWAGSDDVVLRPSDPGYAAAAGTAAPSVTTIATGDYVDLNWGGKNSVSTSSELSGVTASGVFTDALFKSGAIKLATNGTYQVFQPSYDTYTGKYEQDGILQTEIAGQRGLVEISATSGFTLYDSWRGTGPYLIDPVSDGIDNPGSGLGVDDITELETRPPFPTLLRGLKISVRMEDPLSRQMKQMSAAKEFVTH